MQTIETSRAETRTAPIAAPPATVLAVIADPRRLPEWAPAFAAAVAPEGDLWRVDTGGGDLLIDVQVVPHAGTVDLVRRGDTTTGARLRALPSGGGTELLFTILFPRGVDDATVAAQMETVERELATVRALAEAA
ncbi:MAG TPA: SRPBCC family protein [Baekduia sp.]|nr:SRPBCC family protein [Baekduia sp.]